MICSNLVRIMCIKFDYTYSLYNIVIYIYFLYRLKMMPSMELEQLLWMISLLLQMIMIWIQWVMCSFIKWRYILTKVTIMYLYFNFIKCVQCHNHLFQFKKKVLRVFFVCKKKNYFIQFIQFTTFTKREKNIFERVMISVPLS